MDLSIDHAANSEERLRNILAITRGAEYLKEYDAELNKTIDHDQSDPEDFLQAQFSKIHRRLFADTHAQTDKPLGIAVDGDKSARLRSAIIKLANNLYDKNGFAKSVTTTEIALNAQDNEKLKTMYSQRLAKTMAAFYREVRAIEPYEYGNETTLNLFVDCVGRRLNKKGMNFVSFDFSQLSNEELLQLETPGADLEPVFMKMMQYSKNASLQNKENAYGALSDNKVLIEGVPFLRYKKNDVEYLVTVNGGLVRRDVIEEQLSTHLHAQQQVMEFRVKPEAYLANTDAINHKQVVDGYEINDGQAPLVCLDVNPITGLRGPSHDSVIDFIKRNFPNDNIFSCKSEDIAEKFRKAAVSTNMKSLIDIATHHAGLITHQMDKAMEDIFKGKERVKDGVPPQFVMSLGGAGAGKTSVEAVLRAKCGENYVTATLDGAREFSDIYKVLMAADHHADDYKVVEPFSSALRQWIKDRALNKHPRPGEPVGKYNILFDGTGIPFEPRYSDIAREFKEQGFQTAAVCMDAFLVKPNGREAEVSDTALDRVDSRSRKLPYIVVVSKHRDVMSSFLAASKSQYIDKAVAYCSDGPKGSKPYILAETFDSLANGHLESAGEDNIKQRIMAKVAGPTSIFNLINPGKSQFDFAKTVPAFSSNNLAILPLGAQVRGDDRKQRELAIMNVTRFIDMGEKLLFSPHASGPSNILGVQRDMAFAYPNYTDRTVQKHLPVFSLQQVAKTYTDAVTRIFYGAVQNLAL